MLMQNND